MRPLPRKGYQLGWARVAVHVAASGSRPTKEAIEAWIHQHPEAQSLKGSQGALSASVITDPIHLAHRLGFLDDELRCTDLGGVLRTAEGLSGNGEDMFSHPLPVRWVLWLATATAEPSFWRAAFVTWRDGGSTYDWLLAIARSLDSSGMTASLQAVLKEGPTASRDRRSHMVEQYGKPWLGQLSSLGWTNAMPAIHLWAQASPMSWGASDLLDAFQVAERLPKREAGLDRLIALLRALPEELRVAFAPAAARSAIQALGVARGLVEGYVEPWYGQHWDRLLESAGSVGVRETAGSDTHSPNVAWRPDSLADTTRAAEPGAVPTADRGIGKSPTERERSSGNGTPAGEMPEPQPPDARPKSQDTHCRLRDARARAWLRALAWWTKGVSAGDVLLRGHDSWLLLHWTLQHWLRDDQVKRWDKRTQAVSLVGQELTIDWLGDGLKEMAKVNPSHALSVLSAYAKRADKGTLALAALALHKEIFAPTEALRTWIDDGNGWDVLVRHTMIWAAYVVERGLWTVKELRDALHSDTRDLSAEDAISFLAKRALPRGQETYSVTARMVVLGESPEKLESLEGEVEFSLIKDTIAPFSMVEFTSQQKAETSHRAFEKAVLAARKAALVADHHLRVILPDEPTRIADVNGEAVLPSRRVAKADGNGRWGSDQWFEPRSMEIPPDSWGSDEYWTEYRRSGSHEASTDRLAELWVLLEARSPHGDAGHEVCQDFARAAYLGTAEAARDDAWEVASLVGLEGKKPTRWSEWGEWAKVAASTDAIKECEWASMRINSLVDFLSTPSKFASHARTGAGNAMWLFSALYSVRNRRFHEAFRKEDGTESMLARLYDAACVVTSLVLRGNRGRGRPHGPLVSAALSASTGAEPVAGVLDSLSGALGPPDAKIDD